MRWHAETLTRTAAAAAMAIGCAALVGWALDSAMLKGAIGVTITMKANTAVALALAGAALWLSTARSGRRHVAARVLAGVVAAIGGLTLLEHALGVDLSIDQLLFSEAPGETATASPNRMGPPASLCLLLIGLALICNDYEIGRGRFPFRYLPLAVTAIASVSIVGYAFGSPLLYAADRVTGIAWPTAVALLILSVGALTARPENVIVRTLGADNAGGIVARRMLAPSLLLPFGVLLVYGLGTDGGYVDTSLGRGVVAVVMMGGLMALVLTTAQRLGAYADERARTRRALERAEVDALRFSAIVESSNDAIVGKDLNGIVTSWNRAAEKLFGYTAGEMIGQSIVKVFPVETTHEELEILRRVRRGERVEIFDALRRHKDGSLFHVSLSISPILDATGRVVGVSKIARDITERKRTEAEREALLQSERAARTEAEHAARVRDEFIAVVSHELRTPLNGILGWAHYLKHAKVDASTLGEGIAAIERGARAQAQLVEDLLDMNRITTGRLALDLKPVDLRHVVESAIATVRPAADGKRIRLTTSFDANVGIVVGDPDRLQQVVWNLLSNAVKFTPLDGSVDVALRRGNGHVEVEVSDTGEGIEPDFLPHVFERFRQADSSMTRSHGGMGLGLSIAQQLAELHGGTIAAASEGRGRGAVFTLRLPAAGIRGSAIGQDDHDEMPPLEPAFAADLRTLDLSGIEVLVVDDDRDTRELVERVLTGHRARVATATSADEALAILRERKIDVLVSDIGMPGADGYELIRAVRNDLGIDSITTPAVALTAYARSEDRTRAMLAGYQMHIAKPVVPQELAATVASFVGRAHTETGCR